MHVDSESIFMSGEGKLPMSGSFNSAIQRLSSQDLGTFFIAASVSQFQKD